MFIEQKINGTFRAGVANPQQPEEQFEYALRSSCKDTAVAALEEFPEMAESMRAYRTALD